MTLYVESWLQQASRTREITINGGWGGGRNTAIIFNAELKIQTRSDVNTAFPCEPLL